MKKKAKAIKRKKKRSKYAFADLAREERRVARTTLAAAEQRRSAKESPPNPHSVVEVQRVPPVPKR